MMYKNLHLQPFKKCNLQNIIHNFDQKLNYNYFDILYKLMSKTAKYINLIMHINIKIKYHYIISINTEMYLNPKYIITLLKNIQIPVDHYINMSLEKSLNMHYIFNNWDRNMRRYKKNSNSNSINLILY